MQVNGNILKLQMEMQRLLQTRLFSMNHAVVSPEQKENLFSTVAELFDQSCSSLELALNDVSSRETFRCHYLAPLDERLRRWGGVGQTARTRAAETAQWWEEAVESALGWVSTAVTTVEVAVPSPRAQILRLAAIVDAAALTLMAEKVSWPVHLAAVEAAESDPQHGHTGRQRPQTRTSARGGERGGRES